MPDLLLQLRVHNMSRTTRAYWCAGLCRSELFTEYLSNALENNDAILRIAEASGKQSNAAR